MPFDCFLNAYNANRYSSISLTERGVFDFLETLVYQLTSLQETYQNPRFSSRAKKKKKKKWEKFRFERSTLLSFFFNITSPSFYTWTEKRLGRDRERNIVEKEEEKEEEAKKWTEEVEEDVNVSCSAPRNGSMILASRGVWAARRTSIVGPSPLKERRKGRSRGPEGGGGGSRGGGGSGGRPGASHGARRESRREEVSILRDTPRARSARAHTGWLNNFVARKTVRVFSFICISFLDHHRRA